MSQAATLGRTCQPMVTMASTSDFQYKKFRPARFGCHENHENLVGYHGWWSNFYTENYYENSKQVLGTFVATQHSFRC